MTKLEFVFGGSIIDFSQIVSLKVVTFDHLAASKISLYERPIALALDVDAPL